MKQTIILLSLLLMFSCVFTPMGAGTLGASASFQLRCMEEETFEYMEMVTKTEKFAVPEDLEDLANWWERGGFDFLTYWIYKYENSLYCVTYQKHDNSLSVRSKCDIEAKKWTHAVDFDDREHEKAKVSLEMLLLGLHCVIR